MATIEVAVVGAGPAGVAAAVAASRAGAAVTLLDEYPEPGGQYLKGAPLPGARPLSATEKRGQMLLQALRQSEVALQTETLAWGVEKTQTGGALRLATYSPAGFKWLEAGAVIVATGARELVIPFPGWTLPGMMTLGAAHLLTKANGVLPGDRVLLAGSGPLSLPVMHALTHGGAEVVAVLEASHLGQWLSHGPALWGQWDRLWEGWVYVKDMLRARIPYRTGYTVARAIGDGALEAVVTIRVDRGGRPLPDSEETLAVDALCLGFGFVPNIDLTELAGCAHEFDPTRGGWVPTVNARLETSVPGIYAAGETTGVDGAGAAMLEGQVAGLAAAQRLGHLSDEELQRALAAVSKQRRRYRRFGAMLNTLFAPRPGLDKVTAPETIICRCEEVSVAEVRDAVRQGARELDGLKTLTRVGQGACQGRTCGPLLSRLIAQETGQPAMDAGRFHVRPPLKPIPLGTLKAEEAL